MNISEIELPSNRKFGLLFTIIFLVIAWYLIENHSYSGYSSIGIAALFFVIALTKEELLLPLNKLWMRLGLVLGMVVNPIVLGFIFFIMITPISLSMRLFGRDELRLKLKPRASHWKSKDTTNLVSESFKNQF